MPQDKNRKFLVTENCSLPVMSGKRKIYLLYKLAQRMQVGVKICQKARQKFLRDSRFSKILHFSLEKFWEHHPYVFLHGLPEDWLLLL